MISRFCLFGLASLVIIAGSMALATAAEGNAETFADELIVVDEGIDPGQLDPISAAKKKGMKGKGKKGMKKGKGKKKMTSEGQGLATSPNAVLYEGAEDLNGVPVSQEEINGQTEDIAVKKKGKKGKGKKGARKGKKKSVAETMIVEGRPAFINNPLLDGLVSSHRHRCDALPEDKTSSYFIG